MHNPVKRKYNRDNFVIINSALSSVNAFPFFGTLLGLCREGDILKNDDDVDFYLDIRHRERAIALLGEAGFQVDAENSVNLTPYFCQGIRQIDGIDTYVDLYFYETSEELPYIVERWNFKGLPDRLDFHIHIDKKILFPLGKRIFFGSDVYFPRRARSCCEFLYGSGWQKKRSKVGGEYDITIFKNQPELVLKGTVAYELIDQNRRLEAQSSQLHNALDDIRSERETMRSENEGLIERENSLRDEMSRILGARDRLKQERDAFAAERHQLASSREQLAAERDELVDLTCKLAREQKALGSEIGALEQRIFESIADRIHAEASQRALLDALDDAGADFSRVGLLEDVFIREVELLAANGFDFEFYLETHVDVRENGIDPRRHFAEFGRVEGRSVRFAVPNSKKIAT